MTNKEKPKAGKHFAALEHGDAFKRRQALHELARLETETDDEELAIHQHAVVARLEDSDGQVRKAALQTLGQLGKLDSTWLARHASDVVARLEDSEAGVRTAALETMGRLEQARLDLYAHILIPMLEDSSWDVREGAIIALGFLEPDKIVRQTGDYVNVRDVRLRALQTLFKLEPAMLAQHADAVLARLEDQPEPHAHVRKEALMTLAKLEPAKLAQYANAVLAMLEDVDHDVREEAMRTLRALPRFVTRPGDFFDTRSLRSRLLGRLGWYRCRLPLRVQRVALYWYALPYRPSGPGHARDVEAWGRIAENQDHKLGITTAATRRKRCKTDMHAGTQPNERQTRLRSRNSKSPRSE